MAMRSAADAEPSRGGPDGGAGVRFRADAAAVRMMPSPADGAVSECWAATMTARRAAARAREVEARWADLRNLWVCVPGFPVTPGCGPAVSFWAVAGSAARRRTMMAPTIRMGTPARP